MCVLSTTQTREREPLTLKDRPKIFNIETSPRPWRLNWESEEDELFNVIHHYVNGIKDANNEWVIRFDDDYGTNQFCNANSIVRAINYLDETE